MMAAGSQPYSSSLRTRSQTRLPSLVFLLATCTLSTSPLHASCELEAYTKCPQPDGHANSFYVRPWHLLVDSVVEQASGSADWVYYWCLKITPPIDYEIEVDWQDGIIDWNQSTTCGGYAGVRVPSSHKPSELKRTKINIASGRSIIRPYVRKPDVDLAMILPDERHEYRTEVMAALPLKSESSDLGAIELTIMSGYARSAEDVDLVEYYVEYYDEAANGESFASFKFDDKDVADYEALSGSFIAEEEKQRIEFSNVGSPTNLLSTITFMDSAGTVIGRMPVSLALPSE